LKISLITDAAPPQVNGVVNTLRQTIQCLEAFGDTVQHITPAPFSSIPCPTYPEIRLSVGAGRAVAEAIDAFMPDAVHIATEGPLGLAARRHCLRTGRVFTTAYHTRFPEYVHTRFRIPLSITYRFLRWFHGPSKAVMAPTKTVIDDLVRNGIRQARHWTRGVDVDLFTPMTERPHNSESIFLYVGRVSVEKNIEAFLALDLPGKKLVVGDGPLRRDLEVRFPDVQFVGEKRGAELVGYYQRADVFVFPSKTDTFGLVLLEALACGTPVAGYPVTGPLDVVGASPAAVLSTDLRAACISALTVSRGTARAEALRNSWEAATRQFEGNLHPNRV
jgi:glycosyltransferase involved in cell wall biosynthesis